jgi:hypothetical protein
VIKETFVRVILVILFLVLLLLPRSSFVAQSPYASIVGIVLDPDSKTIPGAEIIVVNDLTRVQYQTKTNNDGIYAVPNLPPGPYRVQVSKVGFKTIIKPDIILNVQDALSVNFTLPIGASSITVTVEGGAPLVNTQSAAVSTVVDHTYVENMPLNGRSFQDLILLTPGVVTNSPQTVGPSIGANGEFSVNGQRTESNYYTVDGVSANVGIAPGSPTSGTGGSLSASTALGTTQALVSVDALEEFRVQSSTYSAEYGRNPGGQFSFATRSGTNEWHGTVFDYLRNNFFDANDWFNNYYGQPEPPLRQNDFGGTLGAPLRVPHLYNGASRTFFFFSYEGLRLLQPQASSISYVPDPALRQSATSPALRQVLDAFPVANGPDLGGGVAEYIGTWSNRNLIDSVSLRLDHWASERTKLFFRFSDTPSVAGSRGFGNDATPSIESETRYTSRSYTFGATHSFSNAASNEFRANYASNEGTYASQLDSFGGAKAVALTALQGINTGVNPSFYVAVGLSLSGYVPEIYEQQNSGIQRQWNLVDTTSLTIGRHQLKFGVDYRRLTPVLRPYSPFLQYFYFSESSVEANLVDTGQARNNLAAYPVYSNFSAFGQDDWKITARLSLSAGLRWELNPAPSASLGNSPYTISGGGNLKTMTLAPQGTALWDTTWYNFAPRIGAAYTLRATPGHETVLRGGGGVFFDTGQQLGSLGYQGPGFSARESFGGSQPPVSFPIIPAQVVPTVVNPPVPPYTGSTVSAFATHLQLPYTLQWSASVEQAMGKSQVLTFSYVGSHAARLLEETEVNAEPLNPNFGYVEFFRNGLTSDYNAAQVQFQRRLSAGLQVLGAYTWSHSIDYGSQNGALPYIRGNSDFDVRHNLSVALSYDLPEISTRLVARGLLHHWGIDSRFSARTGFPVTLNGRFSIDPATGAAFYSGLDLVPGESLYVTGAQFPGGRSINPADFQYVAAGQSGDAPRNFVRGFGAVQTNLAVRREFPLRGRLRLQFRAETFNIFNHPNFGSVDPNYCSGGPGCTFGQATATLAQSLGVLSPLYQTGGPRSMQFALRLKF